MERKKTNYKFMFEIFMVFFKISPMTFGGGFAMIPIMEDEMVNKKKWLSKENLVDIFAVSQSLPGAIAVNSATFVGYQIGGILGALSALLGIVLPTFGIIILLATLLGSVQQNIHVQAALQGIRPVVVALIASAAYKMSKVSIVDKTCLAISCVCILALLVFKSLSLILVIFLGAVFGIMIVKARAMKNLHLYEKKASGEKL